MATINQLLQNALVSIDPLTANETKRIYLKETLQALVLDFIYNHPVYRGLNFYGGTCLRVLYRLNRLSEDIDLDNSTDIGLTNFADDILAHFKKNLGYRDISLKYQESRHGIVRVTLRLPVLFELGLSPHHDEMLHLKVEISQHHQVSVIQRTPTIHFGRSFVPAHFSLETMMAGKMIACLERSFQVGRTAVAIKGRDFYDLLWFMQQRIRPLEKKLEQDSAKFYSVSTAMLAIQEKVKKIKPGDLALDLLPLFEQRTFIEGWIASFHATFDSLLSYYL
jgi:predicted nucleotidyltransferase component of viral defense system